MSTTNKNIKWERAVRRSGGIIFQQKENVAVSNMLFFRRRTIALGFLTSLTHKSFLDDTDKVPVQQGINHEIDAFLETIPYAVNMFVFLRNLEACRNPDAINRFIYGRNKHRNRYLESQSFATIRQENGNSVDDDLEQKLHLKCPRCN
jgi:hypothetical protein